MLFIIHIGTYCTSIQQVIMKKDIDPKFAAKEIANYILARRSDKDVMLAVCSVIEVLHRDNVLSKKFLKQLRKELNNDNLYISLQ